MRAKNNGMPKVSVKLPDDLKSYQDTELLELLSKSRKMIADEKNRQKSSMNYDISQLI